MFFDGLREGARRVFDRTAYLPLLSSDTGRELIAEDAVERGEAGKDDAQEMSDVTSEVDTSLCTGVKFTDHVLANCNKPRDGYPTLFESTHYEDFKQPLGSRGETTDPRFVREVSVQGSSVAVLYDREMPKAENTGLLPASGMLLTHDILKGSLLPKWLYAQTDIVEETMKESKCTVLLNRYMKFDITAFQERDVFDVNPKELFDIFPTVAGAGGERNPRQINDLLSRYDAFVGGLSSKAKKAESKDFIDVRATITKWSDLSGWFAKAAAESDASSLVEQSSFDEGLIGITYDPGSGRLYSVSEDGQARKRGVLDKWKILLIEGLPFNSMRFRDFKDRTKTVVWLKDRSASVDFKIVDQDGKELSLTPTEAQLPFTIVVSIQKPDCKVPEGASALLNCLYVDSLRYGNKAVLKDILEGKSRLLTNYSRVKVANSVDEAELLKCTAESAQEVEFTQYSGYIDAGGDILIETMTIEEAKKKALELPGCKGFSISGEPTSEPTTIYFKNKWNLYGEGWTSWKMEGRETNEVLLPPQMITWSAPHHLELKADCLEVKAWKRQEIIQDEFTLEVSPGDRVTAVQIKAKATQAATSIPMQPGVTGEQMLTTMAQQSDSINLKIVKSAENISKQFDTFVRNRGAEKDDRMVKVGFDLQCGDQFSCESQKDMVFTGVAFEGEITEVGEKKNDVWIEVWGTDTQDRRRMQLVPMAKKSQDADPCNLFIITFLHVSSSAGSGKRRPIEGKRLNVRIDTGRFRMFRMGVFGTLKSLLDKQGAEAFICNDAILNCSRPVGEKSTSTQWRAFFDRVDRVSHLMQMLDHDKGLEQLRPRVRCLTVMTYDSDRIHLMHSHSRYWVGRATEYFDPNPKKTHKDELKFRDQPHPQVFQFHYRSVAVSPCGLWLVAITHQQFVVWSVKDGSVVDGQSTKRLIPSKEGCQLKSVAWRHVDGQSSRSLILGCTTGSLLIYENTSDSAANGAFELVSIITSLHNNPVTHVALTFDSNFVISASQSSQNETDTDLMRIRTSTLLFAKNTYGIRKYMRKRGKYYYEVRLLRDVDQPQIGYLAKDYAVGGEPGQGVGEDQNGWAADGMYGRQWHNGQTFNSWPSSWQIGDVIGTAVDMEDGKMRFSRNGEWREAATISFTPGKAIYPAVSMSGEFVMHVLRDSWHYDPPNTTYRAWAESGIFTQPKYEEKRSNFDIQCYLWPYWIIGGQGQGKVKKNKALKPLSKYVDDYEKYMQEKNDKQARAHMLEHLSEVQQVQAQGPIQTDAVSSNWCSSFMTTLSTNIYALEAKRLRGSAENLNDSISETRQRIQELTPKQSDGKYFKDAEKLEFSLESKGKLLQVLVLNKYLVVSLCTEGIVVHSIDSTDADHVMEFKIQCPLGTRASMLSTRPGIIVCVPSVPGQSAGKIILCDLTKGLNSKVGVTRDLPFSHLIAEGLDDDNFVLLAMGAFPTSEPEMERNRKARLRWGLPTAANKYATSRSVTEGVFPELMMVGFNKTPEKAESGETKGSELAPVEDQALSLPFRLHVMKVRSLVNLISHDSPFDTFSFNFAQELKSMAFTKYPAKKNDEGEMLLTKGDGEIVPVPKPSVSVDLEKDGGELDEMCPRDWNQLAKAMESFRKRTGPASQVGSAVESSKTARTFKHVTAHVFVDDNPYKPRNYEALARFYATARDTRSNMFPQRRDSTYSEGTDTDRLTVASTVTENEGLAIAVHPECHDFAFPGVEPKLKFDALYKAETPANSRDYVKIHDMRCEVNFSQYVPKEEIEEKCSSTWSLQRLGLIPVYGTTYSLVLLFNVCVSTVTTERRKKEKKEGEKKEGEPSAADAPPPADDVVSGAGDGGDGAGSTSAQPDAGADEYEDVEVVRKTYSCRLISVDVTIRVQDDFSATADPGTVSAVRINDCRRASSILCYSGYFCILACWPTSDEKAELKDEEINTDSHIWRLVYCKMDDFFRSGQLREFPYTDFLAEYTNASYEWPKSDLAEADAVCNISFFMKPLENITFTAATKKRMAVWSGQLRGKNGRLGEVRICGVPDKDSTSRQQIDMVTLAMSDNGQPVTDIMATRFGIIVATPEVVYFARRGVLTTDDQGTARLRSSSIWYAVKDTKTWAGEKAKTMSDWVPRQDGRWSEWACSIVPVTSSGEVVAIGLQESINVKFFQYDEKTETYAVVPNEADVYIPYLARAFEYKKQDNSSLALFGSDRGYSAARSLYYPYIMDFAKQYGFLVLTPSSLFVVPFPETTKLQDDATGSGTWETYLCESNQLWVKWNRNQKGDSSGEDLVVFGSGGVEAKLTSAPKKDEKGGGGAAGTTKQWEACAITLYEPKKADNYDGPVLYIYVLYKEKSRGNVRIARHPYPKPSTTAARSDGEEMGSSEFSSSIEVLWDALKVSPSGQYCVTYSHNSKAGLKFWGTGEEMEDKWEGKMDIQQLPQVQCLTFSEDSRFLVCCCDAGSKFVVNIIEVQKRDIKWKVEYQLDPAEAFLSCLSGGKLSAAKTDQLVDHVILRTSRQRLYYQSLVSPLNFVITPRWLSTGLKSKKKLGFDGLRVHRGKQEYVIIDQTRSRVNLTQFAAVTVPGKEIKVSNSAPRYYEVEILSDGPTLLQLGWAESKWEGGPATLGGVGDDSKSYSGAWNRKLMTGDCLGCAIEYVEQSNELKLRYALNGDWDAEKVVRCEDQSAFMPAVSGLCEVEFHLINMKKTAEPSSAHKPVGEDQTVEGEGGAASGYKPSEMEMTANKFSQYHCSCVLSSALEVPNTSFTSSSYAPGHFPYFARVVDDSEQVDDEDHEAVEDAAFNDRFWKPEQLQIMAPGEQMKGSWLAVDLGSEFWVSGLQLQGLRDHHVCAVKVWLSTDPDFGEGKTEYFLKEAKRTTHRRQDLPDSGAMDSHLMTSPDEVYDEDAYDEYSSKGRWHNIFWEFPVVNARYVKVWPQDSEPLLTHAPGMRLEVFYTAPKLMVFYPNGVDGHAHVNDPQDQTYEVYYQQPDISIQRTTLSISNKLLLGDLVNALSYKTPDLTRLHEGLKKDMQKFKILQCALYISDMRQNLTQVQWVLEDKTSGTSEDEPAHDPVLAPSHCLDADHMVLGLGYGHCYRTALHEFSARMGKNDPEEAQKAKLMLALLVELQVADEGATYFQECLAPAHFLTQVAVPWAAASPLQLRNRHGNEKLLVRPLDVLFHSLRLPRDNKADEGGQLQRLRRDIVLHMIGCLVDHFARIGEEGWWHVCSLLKELPNELLISIDFDKFLVVATAKNEEIQTKAVESLIEFNMMDMKLVKDHDGSLSKWIVAIPGILGDLSAPWETPLYRATHPTQDDYVSLTENDYKKQLEAFCGKTLITMVTEYKWNSYVFYVHLFETCKYMGFLALFTYVSLQFTDLEPNQHPRQVHGFTFLLICVCFSFMTEVLQMCRENPWAYWTSLWNVLDWFINFSIVLSYYCMHISASSTDEDLFWRETSLSICSVSSLFVWFRVLQYALGFSQTGQFVRVVMFIFQDMVYFLIMLFVVILGFSHGFYLFYHRDYPALFKQQSIQDKHLDGFLNYKTTVMTVYRMMLGDFPTELMDKHWLTQVYFMTFSCAVTLTLLNVLIAKMSEAYGKTMEHASGQHTLWITTSVSDIDVKYKDLLRLFSKRVFKTWIYSVVQREGNTLGSSNAVSDSKLSGVAKQLQGAHHGSTSSLMDAMDTMMEKMRRMQRTRQGPGGQTTTLPMLQDDPIGQDAETYAAEDEQQIGPQQLTTDEIIGACSSATSASFDSVQTDIRGVRKQVDTLTLNMDKIMKLLERQASKEQSPNGAGVGPVSEGPMGTSSTRAMAGDADGGAGRVGSTPGGYGGSERSVGMSRAVSGSTSASPGEGGARGGIAGGGEGAGDSGAGAGLDSGAATAGGGGGDMPPVAAPKNRPRGGCFCVRTAK